MIVYQKINRSPIMLKIWLSQIFGKVKIQMTSAWSQVIVLQLSIRTSTQVALNYFPSWARMALKAATTTISLAALILVLKETWMIFNLSSIKMPADLLKAPLLTIHSIGSTGQIAGLTTPLKCLTTRQPSSIRITGSNWSYQQPIISIIQIRK